MITRIHLLFCILILTCCTAKVRIPNDVLNQNQMTQILWDLLKADALASELYTKDSSSLPKPKNLNLYQEVFSSYAITKETFDKSYTFYEQHPELMKTVLDTMNVQREKMKIKSLYKNISKQRT